MKKKHRSIETLKSRYGVMFISPWIIGIVLFFIVPIIQSIFFGFADISIGEGGTESSFVGTKNFYEILVKDPSYTDNLLSTFSSIFISLPFILIVSMVLGLLLNGSYKGRIFFRGLYFLPVIIASGAVLNLFLTAASSNATETALAADVSFGMIDFTKVLEGLNLPLSVQTFLSSALSNVFMLIWQSGIQIVLIIAGLQSIPDLLYEVAKVEGATKWEEFWYITLPMMMRTMLLVVIFTIVELVSSSSNQVVTVAFGQFNSMEYGIGSAMLWFYYLIIIVFLVLLFTVYRKVFFKRWG